MPLLDHFHPPLATERNWEGFHIQWTNAIVEQLNLDRLPPKYFAESNIYRGRDTEIDAAPCDKWKTLPGSNDSDEGDAATMGWQPPRATIQHAVNAFETDVCEVRVFNEAGFPTLVAAVELVSPRNKDRPESRRVFAIKCASYLQAGVSVIVVDVVTGRRHNLHEELFRLLELPNDEPFIADVYAAAYRVYRNPDADRLEAWPEPLEVSGELPTLPLWLAEDFAVPLGLEESYTATRQSLRIP